MILIAASYMTCDDCGFEVNPGDEFYLCETGDALGIDCGCAELVNVSAN